MRCKVVIVVINFTVNVVHFFVRVFESSSPKLLS